MQNDPMTEPEGNEKFRALQIAFDQLPVCVGIFHMSGKPVFLNRAFCALHNVDQVWHGEDASFEKLIAEGALDAWKQNPTEFFHKVRATLLSGKTLDAQIEVGDKIIAVHDIALEGRYILTVQQDITARVKAEERVLYLARNDSLTDIPNRSTFIERLDNLIEEATVKSASFGILSVDVDRFKDINDIFGHAAGDAVLREMARRFRSVLGADDMVARLGGDEFVFISGAPSQPEATALLAHVLHEASRAPVDFEGQALTIGLSIGIAVFPENGADRAQLLNSADAALYRAKADGRGVIRSFEQKMDEKIHEQRVLQRDLKLAIERHQLELYYQPQASVDKTIYGFEALLRWHHPERGLISPADFIPLAEESGLIIDIGDWVLRKACLDAAGWKKPLRVSVNLSPVQFRHGDICAKVHQILVETGLAASRLELEITEGVLIQNFSRVLHSLRAIKNLGVHIAMDDFGTGYSSLSYLQAFPFDTLKIDKSFIARLSQGGHANEIVRAVIGLGRGLNIPIVAEGVETEAQRAFLSGEQCQNIQGYLIGAAAPIERFAWLFEADSQPDAAGLVSELLQSAVA